MRLSPISEGASLAWLRCPTRPQLAADHPARWVIVDQKHARQIKSTRSSNSDMDNRVLEGEATARSSNAPSQAGQSSRAPRKRKNHRGGKKKRSRRKSFAISQDDVPHDEDTIQDPALDAARQEFYRMHGRSFSNTSIDSEVLLDHRYGITPCMNLALEAELTGPWTAENSNHSYDPVDRPLPRTCHPPSNSPAAGCRLCKAATALGTTTKTIISMRILPCSRAPDG